MSDVRIKTTAVVREVLNDRTCHATLRNGKCILAYAQPLDHLPPLKVGDTCHVLLSLCNFNEARIVPDDMSRIRVNHPVVECL